MSDKLTVVSVFAAFLFLVNTLLYFACSYCTGINTPKETDNRYQDVNSERLGKCNSKSAA